MKQSGADFGRWLAAVVLLVIVVGCEKPTAQSQTGPRDHLVGWFKLPGRNEKKEVISGHDTLIPVFKRAGIYYSVCRGVEVPFKECPDGLEWGLEPSSMTGTKLGWDAASKTYYLAVMDQQASNFSDGRYGCGEKNPMTRIEKPSGLLDAKTRRPRTNQDFLGWYKPVCFPYVRWGIRKDGDRYLSVYEEMRTPGLWETGMGTEPTELTPIRGRLGFTGIDKSNHISLTYNEALKRFELVRTTPSVIRMPLVRISAPASSEGGNAPGPTVAIGIPSWH